MDEILRLVRDISGNHQQLWFRGHSSNSYKLNSGLYRISKDNTTVLKHENNIYNAFINLGSLHIEQFHTDKEWHALFMMQHYGMYTRLLDWTSSFITALYFANLNRKPTDTATIWIIDPIKLNNHCTNLYEKDIDEFYSNIGYITLETLPNRIKNYTNYFNRSIHIKSFALMPRRSNKRLISQNGFFTVQGTEGLTLDEEYYQYMNEFIYRIDLPPETYESSMSFLKINGVDYYSLFGGVDGLCNYIKHELLEIKLENL